MTNLTAEALRDLYDKQADITLPVMFEVYNPDITWSDEEKETYGQTPCYVRFINSDIKVKYKGNTYLPCVFEYQMPESDGSKIGNASITISALDGRVRRLLRSIKLPSTFKIIATYAKIKKDDDTGNFYYYAFQELNSISCKMLTASSNKSTASFNLYFDRSLSVNVPTVVATKDKVPSTRG